ncbi:hypothetical protein L7F22_000653 [Adiantum nelumboides]|nr:hypothetical protein [Adiantum nelumboides]
MDDGPLRIRAHILGIVGHGVGGPCEEAPADVVEIVTRLHVDARLEGEDSATFVDSLVNDLEGDASQAQGGASMSTHAKGMTNISGSSKSNVGSSSKKRKRDQVGIGGSWDEFLQYIRDAFSSDNVKLILGGPASSIGGHGATSARVVSQKSKGMPRISLNLEKLAGSSAEDVMGLITIELLKGYKHQSNALVAEQKSVYQLKETLAKSKEEVRLLQEQVDATLYRGKRRGRPGASQFSVDANDVSFSQFDSKNGSTQDTSALKTESTKRTSGKAVPLRSKVHLAHAKRAKQRGSRLADADDE